MVPPCGVAWTKVGKLGTDKIQTFYRCRIFFCFAIGEFTRF